MLFQHIPNTPSQRGDILPKNFETQCRTSEKILIWTLWFLVQKMNQHKFQKINGWNLKITQLKRKIIWNQTSMTLGFSSRQFSGGCRHQELCLVSFGCHVNDTGKSETTETDPMKGQAVWDVSVCEVSRTVDCNLKSPKRRFPKKTRIFARSANRDLPVCCIYSLCSDVCWIYICCWHLTTNETSEWQEKHGPEKRFDVKKSEAQRMASKDVEVHGCGRGVYVNSQHPSVTSPCAVAVSVCFLKEWTWMEEPAYW